MEHKFEDGHLEEVDQLPFQLQRVGVIEFLEDTKDVLSRVRADNIGHSSRRYSDCEAYSHLLERWIDRNKRQAQEVERQEDEEGHCDDLLEWGK